MRRAASRAAKIHEAVCLIPVSYPSDSPVQEHGTVVTVDNGRRRPINKLDPQFLVSTYLPKDGKWVVRMPRMSAGAASPLVLAGLIIGYDTATVSTAENRSAGPAYLLPPFLVESV